MAEPVKLSTEMTGLPLTVWAVPFTSDEFAPHVKVGEEFDTAFELKIEHPDLTQFTMPYTRQIFTKWLGTNYVILMEFWNGNADPVDLQGQLQKV